MIVIIFSAAPVDACELCGVEGQELRPYGPGFKFICIDCAFANIEETRKNFRAWLENDDNPEGRTLQ
jgi:hypothetical protein